MKVPYLVFTTCLFCSLHAMEKDEGAYNQGTATKSQLESATVEDYQKLDEKNPVVVPSYVPNHQYINGDTLYMHGTGSRGGEFLLTFKFEGEGCGHRHPYIPYTPLMASHTPN